MTGLEPDSREENNAINKERWQKSEKEDQALF